MYRIARWLTGERVTHLALALATISATLFVVGVLVLSLKSCRL